MGLWDRISRTLDELSEDFLPGDLRDRVEGARELLLRGQYGAAAAALEQVVREKPDHATALYLLGAAQLRRNRPREAVDAFQRATAARAGFAEAHTGLGEAFLALGDPTAAVTTVRQALAIGGDRELLADAYRVLGRAHLAAGAVDKGLRELRKSLAEDPDGLDAALALAEALLATPGADAREARAPLERTCAKGTPPPAALAALGRIQSLCGDHTAAEATLGKALAAELPTVTRAEVLAGLSRALLERGEHRGAHERLMEALELEPRNPALHAALGDLHRAVRNPDAALAAYETALSLPGEGGDGGAALLHRALDTALAANLVEKAGVYAGKILAREPGHPAALVGRALAMARIDLEARRREYGVDAPPEDLYALARRAHTLTLARPELASLATEAAAAVAAIDSPLLVTVMGEFSSGKSTFVNAFLGASVAPTGITPTTATINILKYGRDRGGRIVYLDDRVRALAWDEVAAVLAAVDAEEARRIRWVEVLYPLEILSRIHIVDTPGLNSIQPEHEETARAFIAQADAIVWLFTIGQAGKATERDALEKIRAEGKRVLGVLNKVDQASPAEVDRIVAHVQRELGDLVEALVPVSARQALAARAAADTAALEAARWPALDAALEERFFREARSLKRAACGKRLAHLLAEARARVDDRAAQARAAAERLDASAVAARAAAVLFTRCVVPEERQALAERVATLYRAAAREVLELVRPRKTPFGSHKATAPDRDFLLGFFERGLTTTLQPTLTRVTAEIEQAGRDAQLAARETAAVTGDAAPAELARETAAALALVDARVFDRYRAYLRGYLRGGHLDEFFAATLPHLELSEDAVTHALHGHAPDLDAELAAPLAAHGNAVLTAFADRLAHLAALARAAHDEAEQATAAALATLATVERPRA